MIQWVTILSIPIILFTSLWFTSNVVSTRFPRLKNKRVCLLIAHPDDEAMFFAPTLLALTDPNLGNHVKILCLSSGNADGLGDIRKKELVKSGILLGLRKEDDVFVVDSPDFQDSMTAVWSTEKVSALLSSAFAPHLSTHESKNASSKAPTATIDVLITFDNTGVSSHPNHISLYHGARHFISSLVKNRPGWECPVDLYTLSSINVMRKYSGAFDALFSLIAVVSSKKGRNHAKHPSRLLFMSGAREYLFAQRAMTTAHVSQMRWFRWGWITLSRYMVLNDLNLEKVS